LEIMMRIVALFAALFVLTAPVIAAERWQPKAVASAVEAGTVVLIDIRTPEEWADTGLATPAIPADMISPDFMAKLAEIVASNPGKRLAFICRSSNRSSQVTAALEAQAGYTDLIDVAGGMLGKGDAPGWIAEGLPVRQP
jgi:rhodanese-related sulfurtransferase